MRIDILLIGLLAVMLSACVNRTAYDEPVNHNKHSVTPPLPTHKRKTIAIGRFANESVYKSGLAKGKSKDRIGKLAADMLIRHLVATRRFNVVERRDIGKLKGEAELMGRTGQRFKQNLKNVDALIVGSVVGCRNG